MKRIETVSIATIDSLAAQLDAPAADVRALVDAIKTIPSGHRCRGIVTAGLPGLVERIDPGVLPRYLAISSRLGETPALSFAPFGHMVLRYMGAASLLYPGAPLAQSMETVFTEMMRQFAELPYAGPLVIASDNDPARLLELCVSLPQFWVNFGRDWSFERVDPHSARLHFTDFVSALAPYLAPGFFRGLIEWIGGDYDYVLEVHGPMLWSAHVSW